MTHLIHPARIKVPHPITAETLGLQFDPVTRQRAGWWLDIGVIALPTESDKKQRAPQRPTPRDAAFAVFFGARAEGIGIPLQVVVDLGDVVKEDDTGNQGRVAVSLNRLWHPDADKGGATCSLRNPSPEVSGLGILPGHVTYYLLHYQALRGRRFFL